MAEEIKFEHGLIALSLILLGFSGVWGQLFIGNISVLFLTNIFIKNYKEFIIKNIMVWLLIGLFGFYAITTSIWSSEPFFTVLRAIYFIIVTLFFVNAGFLKTGNKFPFNPLVMVNLVFISIALIALILGQPVDAWTGGNGMGFKGFFIHQNNLAGVLLYSFPIYFLLYGEIKAKRYKIILTLLIVINLMLIILSYMRGAIIVSMLMTIIFLLMNFSVKKVGIILSIILFITILLSFIQPQFKNTLFKNENHLGDRRSISFNLTKQAAYKGGLWGIGYGTADTSLTHPVVSSIKYGILKREKSFGLLALIEEVGIFGAVLFLAILAYPFILFVRKFNIGKVMVMTILSAFIIHAQIEAWFTEIGGMALPAFFYFYGLSLRHNE